MDLFCLLVFPELDPIDWLQVFLLSSVYKKTKTRDWYYVEISLSFFHHVTHLPVCYQSLLRGKEEFTTKSMPVSRSRDFAHLTISILLWKMSGNGQLEQTQRQVQEVVGVMRNNIDEVKLFSWILIVLNHLD